MKPPLRIAILECDTPQAQTKAKYNGYGGVFKALLETAADELGQPDIISSRKGLELSNFDVVGKQEYPDLEKIDAVLLTGSSKSQNILNSLVPQLSLDINIIPKKETFF